MSPLALLLVACLFARTALAAGAAPFVSVGPGGGGAMFVPSISPHDASLLFVACDMGGAYRSGDGGTTWTMIDKRALRDATACPMLWHPTYGGWIYAVSGATLKMTKDAGLTWSQVVLSPPWGGEPVTALALDEASARTLFIGTTFGAFRSLDGGQTWTACAGVHGKALGIVVDPTTPVGHRIVVIGTNEGVFRSSDSGSTWADSSAGLPSRDIRAFCGAGTAQSGKFACYCTIPSRAVQGRFTGGVFRSMDHGTTWQTAMGTGINSGVGRADVWGDGDIAQYGWIGACRAAPYTVYVTAAGTGYWPPNHTTVYRTDDAGANWRAVAFGDIRGEASGIHANLAPGWITADHIWSWWNGAGGGLAVDAQYPDHAVFTNDGELYQTRDGGGIWTQAYSKPADAEAAPRKGGRWSTTGLDVTNSWQVAFDPHHPGRVFTCYTDIGLEASDDGGATWRWSVDGSPWRNTFYQLCFDPETPDLVWAATSDQHDIPHWSNIEGPKGGGGVCTSRDGGMTWTPSGSGLPDNPVTSVVADPRNPKGARVLYAASFGRGVYRTDDGGRNWAATPGQPGREGNRHVYRLVVQPDGSVYCTVTGRRVGQTFPVPGGLWRSRDRGATWEDLTATLQPKWPGDVVVHPADPNVIWLGVSDVPGNNEGGIYRTIDGGRTWRKSLGTERLPQELSPYSHALFLSMDPRVPDTVYAGITTHGLFVTKNSGKSWTEVPGIPFAGCQRVAFDPANAGTLWVTTFGGGVWRGPAP